MKRIDIILCVETSVNTIQFYVVNLTGFLTITTFKFVKLSSLSYYKFIVYCVIIILLIFCVVDGKINGEMKMENGKKPLLVNKEFTAVIALSCPRYS